MKIWLDDERPVPSGWTGAKTADEALRLLIQCFNDDIKVEEISLDHDLGDESVCGTGYDVLKWLEIEVNNGYEPPIIKIHTANVYARQKMELAVLSIKKILENRRENEN